MPYGTLNLVKALSIPIPRRRQTQLVRGQIADRIAVHGQLRRARGGNDIESLIFELRENLGPDCLNLGHDQVRLVTFDRSAQGRPIEHRKNLAIVR